MVDTPPPRHPLPFIYSNPHASLPSTTSSPTHPTLHHFHHFPHTALPFHNLFRYLLPIATFPYIPYTPTTGPTRQGSEDHSLYIFHARAKVLRQIIGLCDVSLLRGWCFQSRPCLKFKSCCINIHVAVFAVPTRRAVLAILGRHTVPVIPTRISGLVILTPNCPF